MHAGIWRKIAEHEPHYERTSVLRSFKTFQRLTSIPQIIAFVKDSGAEATIERAKLSSCDYSGSCVTDHILHAHINDIKSAEELEALLRSEDVVDHPVVGIECFEHNVEYYIDVYEGGNTAYIEVGEYDQPAHFIRMVQLFKRDYFNQGMHEGHRLRDLAQRILDCAIDREAAIGVFRKYGLDLYALADEPHPVA